MDSQGTGNNMTELAAGHREAMVSNATTKRTIARDRRRDPSHFSHTFYTADTQNSLTSPFI